MNDEHLSDDLPRLLTGEASRGETLAAAEHLRSCPDCQQELVSAVIAHATLTSAHRFAPEVVAPDPADAEPAQLPDLSAVFAQARAEASGGTPVSAARRRPRRQLLVAAAAVAVLAGGGVLVAETVGSGSSGPVAATSVTLTGTGTAQVRVAGGTMHLDARQLPPLDHGHQYEVWLVKGQQLRPLGYVGANRTADLPVPAPVMAQYDTIAISLQKSDQVAFSGVLVAHGAYD